MAGAAGTKASATGGTDAPQSLGPGSKSPADRLKEHADKKRQIEARKAYTPGPGAYTPIKPNQTLNGNSSKNNKTSIGGSAAFASTFRGALCPRSGLGTFETKKLASSRSTTFGRVLCAST